MSARTLEFVTPYRTRSAPRRGLLLLDRNEGSTPPAALLDALAGAAETLRRYPDAGALEAALAERFRVGPERVIVTAGADDAIDRCCRAFLRGGRTLVATEPTFEMLLRYGSSAGGAIALVPWEDAFPVDRVASQLGPPVGLIAIVSPNNPTGCVATREDLARLSAAAGEIPILLDHAYVEYAEADLTAFALEQPNVIVVRTFSKAWGLAGCRVGYALGPAELIRRLRVVGAPYPVAAPSLTLALARLRAGAEDVAAHVARVRRERDELTDYLRAAGVGTSASQANFVLGWFGADAGRVRDGLLAQDVLVRDFTDRLDGALRISLPGEDLGFGRLIRALESVLPLDGSRP